MSDVNSLFKGQASNRSIMVKILKLCDKGLDVVELEKNINILPAMKNSTYSLDSFLTILKEVSAIVCAVDKKDLIESWTTTDLGRSIHLTGVENLYHEHELLTDAFQKMLKFCENLHTTEEITDEFIGNKDITKAAVMPIYLVHQLEEAGGIEWLGDGWKSVAR